MMNLDQWLSLLRTVFKIGGGVMVAHGVGTEADWTTLAGAVITMVPVVWDMTIHSKAGKLAAVEAMPEVHRIVMVPEDTKVSG